MPTMPITKMRTGNYTTGELAKLAGVHLENIRYFERIGLIPAARRGANGRRQFGEDHHRRLVFIRRARELGFSQDEVRTLLHLADGSPDRCAEVKAIADAHLGTIRKKVAALKKMERLLATVSASCGCGRVADCPVIDVLFDDKTGGRYRSVRSRADNAA
jgi:MerR family mercuric resistance operon transcriptional regulator